jgi:HAD superfamily hydrolase (TIGR01509 family)
MVIAMQSRERMIRALIFDFDGLILDTEGPIFRSWQEIYREYGCQLSFEIWSTTIGTTDTDFEPFEALQKQLGQTLDRASITERQQQREAEMILAQPILPGAQAYLETARQLGLKVGLASSSTRQWVTGHLSRLGLIDYFEQIKTSNDVTHTKPDPELYLKALEGLDVPAKQAFALEDSPNGILAAQRAGLFCVAVPNDMTRSLPTGHADLRLDSLADTPLENLLQTIEQRNNGKLNATR